MSLRAMYESKQNSLQSKQDKTEPVILPEELLKRAEEALKALKIEQELREEAEGRANIKEQENKALRTLLMELSETSDSEMPIKLSEKLNEQEKLLSNEQEKNRQLEKRLKEEQEIIIADKKDYDKEKSRLENEISYLKRRLKYDSFDKNQYLLGLQNREKAVNEDRANLDTLIKIKAQEIEQEAVERYKAQEKACEAEKTRYIALQQAEKEQIEAEIERQATARKAELDEQCAQERAEHEQEHIKREQALEEHWTARNRALTAKCASISGITVILGLISAVTAVISVIIAFFHGLLPYLIADGKEIGGWISSNWHSIFGQSFVLLQSLLPILQLALPLIFLIIIGIWTALNFEERKWVVFADKLSVIVMGTSIGISAVFGKQLSDIGCNTVMFPIAIYLIYLFLRWLWTIEVIQGLLEVVKKPIKWWNNLETQENIGYSLVIITIIFGIIIIRNWVIK